MQDAVPVISPEVVGITLGGVGGFVLFIIWGMATLRRAFRRWRFGDEKTRIAKSWGDVQELMTRGDEMSARMAVMHADAVLDKALQAKHFPGEKFATRMQFAVRKYKSLKNVWPAHRLRNDLAHDPHRTLEMSEARRAIASYATALKDLGAL